MMFLRDVSVLLNWTLLDLLFHVAFPISWTEKKSPFIKKTQKSNILQDILIHTDLVT